MADIEVVIKIPEEISGITDNKPIDIDFNEVDCIYREVEKWQKKNLRQKLKR